MKVIPQSTGLMGEVGGRWVKYPPRWCRARCIDCEVKGEKGRHVRGILQKAKEAESQDKKRKKQLVSVPWGVLIWSPQVRDSRGRAHGFLNQGTVSCWFTSTVWGKIRFYGHFWVNKIAPKNSRVLSRTLRPRKPLCIVQKSVSQSLRCRAGLRHLCCRQCLMKCLVLTHAKDTAN